MHDALHDNIREQMISISDEHDRKAWARALGCSENQLLAAVNAVGRSSARVLTYVRTGGGT